MNYFLFLTDPIEFEEGVARVVSGTPTEWTGHSKAHPGDRVLLYLTRGQGIAYEWRVDVGFKAGPREYRAIVSHIRPIEPPIGIDELREEFGQEEWAVPHNMSRYSAVLIPELFVDRILGLREN